MIIAIPRDATCQYEGCTLPATHVACGAERDWNNDRPGHPAPGIYCAEHAVDVSGEGYSEYQVPCPNCGCYFGVDGTVKLPTP